MTRIVGNNDGPGGRNETYDVGSRKNIKRRELVREVEQGKHPDAHIIIVNEQKYVRDNPDSTTKDNVNR